MEARLRSEELQKQVCQGAGSLQGARISCCHCIDTLAPALLLQSLELSYQEVKRQLELLRHQHDAPPDEVSEQTAGTAGLEIASREVDEHRARLTELMRARADAANIPRPEPDGKGRMALSDLTVLVEQCVASERGLSERMLSVERENAAARKESKDLMDGQGALAMKFKKLQDERNELMLQHEQLLAEHAKAVGAAAHRAAVQEVMCEQRAV